MLEMKRVLRDESGFTIAEYVMAIAILLFVSISVMGTLAYAANAGSGTSKRETALGLANQRLEQARNLPYDSVGTVGGYPSGTIPAVETVDGFTVTTEVDWAIDAATSLSSCKTIHIAVSWTSPVGGSVDIESNIAGMSTLANAGDVKIFVVDADTGDPLQGASVTIKPSTGFASTKSTDASGSVRWGKVPAGAITITGSCAGYALDITPLKTATVVSNQLNTWTIQAIKPSTAVITVSNQVPAVMSGVVVTIVGPSGTLSQTTGASGIATFTGLLKGTYTVTGAKTGYAPIPTSIAIIAGGQSYSGSLTMKKNATLTVTVRSSTGVLKDAVLVITPTASGTGVTGADGTAVYDISTTGVAYTVQATLNGYATESSTTAVIGAGQDAVLEIVMTPAVNGKLIITYNWTGASKSDTSDRTIYVYKGTSSSITSPDQKVWTSAVMVYNSKVSSVTTEVALAPGWYWVSRTSSNPNNAKKASNAIAVGVNATVSINRDNN